MFKTFYNVVRKCFNELWTMKNCSFDLKAELIPSFRLAHMAHGGTRQGQRAERVAPTVLLGCFKQKENVYPGR